MIKKNLFFLLLALCCTLQLVGQSSLYNDELRLAQKKGDARAMYMLGVYNRDGRAGVRKNYVEALKWFRQAAEKGHLAAMSDIAKLYLTGGPGISTDLSQAVTWAQKAADAGDYTGASLMGSFYYNGQGIKKDESRALYWYMKALEAKNVSTYSNTASFDQAKARVAELQQAGVRPYSLSQSTHSGNYAQSNTNRNTSVSGGKQTKAPIVSTPTKPVQPPILDFVSGTLAFVDASGRNVIGANGAYSVRFQLKNSGKGVAKGCVVTLNGKGMTDGLIFNDMKLGEIGVGETTTVSVPLTTKINTSDGEVELAVQVNEPNGFGTDPQYLTVKTQAFESPLVQVTDYSLTADGGSTLKRKMPFDLQVMLQNTKHGQADNVTVSIDIPQNVLMIEGNANETFAKMAGGEAKSLVYSLIVNNNYAATTIPIKIHVKEKYGKYAEDRTITLQLDQAMASTKIAVEAQQQRPRSEVAIARLGSDVDKDIPKAAMEQKKIFAIIIANEHYQTVEPVPFALNDGRMFETYCRQTLGIPQQNIRIVTDATLNGMKYQIDWLRQVVETYGGEANAIVYYAGHGIPDEQTQTSYLLPVDGYSGSTSSAYSLDDFYRTLGSLPAKCVTVFLDACFSGTRRDGKMLASARGVAIKAKSSTPQGNMIVFSAAQGDETAYPYNEMQHGMFTYFLLKKLKDSAGNTTLGELGDYVEQEVKRKSIVQNNKIQSPSVIPSVGIVTTWRNLRLK